MILDLLIFSYFHWHFFSSCMIFPGTNDLCRTWSTGCQRDVLSGSLHKEVAILSRGACHWACRTSLASTKCREISHSGAAKFSPAWAQVFEQALDAAEGRNMSSHLEKELGKKRRKRQHKPARLFFEGSKKKPSCPSWACHVP